jgi:hypothetical protein
MSWRHGTDWLRRGLTRVPRDDRSTKTAAGDPNKGGQPEADASSRDNNYLHLPTRCLLSICLSARCLLLVARYPPLAAPCPAAVALTTKHPRLPPGSPAQKRIHVHHHPTANDPSPAQKHARRPARLPCAPHPIEPTQRSCLCAATPAHCRPA